MLITKSSCNCHSGASFAKSCPYETPKTTCWALDKTKLFHEMLLTKCSLGTLAICKHLLFDSRLYTCIKNLKDK